MTQYIPHPLSQTPEAKAKRAARLLLNPPHRPRLWRESAARLESALAYALQSSTEAAERERLLQLRTLALAQLASAREARQIALHVWTDYRRKGQPIPDWISLYHPRTVERNLVSIHEWLRSIDVRLRLLERVATIESR